MHSRESGPWLSTEWGKWLGCHTSGVSKMDSPMTVPLMVVVVSSVVASITDLRSFRIPNGLTFPLIVGGIVYHVIVGGLAGLQPSLVGAFFGFAVLFPLYLMGGMGAGDVKLLVGVGVWLGLPATVFVFFIAGLATGVYSLVLLVWRGRLGVTAAKLRIGLFRLQAMAKHLGTEQRVESVVTQDDRRLRLIPFGAMIALAVCVMLIWSCWSQSNVNQ